MGKALIIVFQSVLIFYFLYSIFNLIFNNINPIKVRQLLRKYKYFEPYYLLEVKYLIYGTEKTLPLYDSFSMKSFDYFSRINVIHFNYRKLDLTEYDKAIIWY